MLRYMNGSKIADKISTTSILSKFETLSVNQLNAQIKLVDMWKANNLINYPTKIHKIDPNELRTTTRAVTSGRLKEVGLTVCAKNTFFNDGVKAWNKAPDSIKNCKTIWAAKKAIKSYVKSLPM